MIFNYFNFLDYFPWTYHCRFAVAVFLWIFQCIIHALRFRRLCDAE